MAVDQDTKRGDRAVVAANSTSDVGVLDTTGALINPATKENQALAITALTTLDTSTSSTQITKGGETVSSSFDLEANMSLKDILLEMKIMNLHLSQITGQSLTEKDL